MTTPLLLSISPAVSSLAPEKRSREPCKSTSLTPLPRSQQLFPQVLPGQMLESYLLLYLPVPSPAAWLRPPQLQGHAERGQAVMDQSFFPMESDNLYDDFYQEEEAFNITMKKCHRKRMEDRVRVDIGIES